MNKTEFTDLLLPIKDKLYRLAKRILISGDEAEDAVQEVYLKMWSKKENIDNYHHPEAFAYKMIKNYCLDRLKSKQAGNLKIVHNNYHTSDNLEERIEANDSVELVLKLLDDLPEQQKMVLQLRDIEELEFVEIAKILEIKEGAVRVALSRARKTLREAMIKKYNYGIG